MCEMHLGTAAVRAEYFVHAPSAVVWVGDLCQVVPDWARSPATAPDSASHLAAFPAQPEQAVFYDPPHAESPPTQNVIMYVSIHTNEFRQGLSYLTRSDIAQLFYEILKKCCHY